MGSLGFVAAARSTYAFVRDQENSDQRLLLPIKVNLGPDTEGFRCHIEVDRTQNLSPPPPRLRWHDEAVEDQRVDDVLTQSSPREQARKAKEQEIKKWLDGLMKPGKRVRSPKFKKKVKRSGYREKTVRKLMPELGYKTEAEDCFPAIWWVIRNKT